MQKRRRRGRRRRRRRRRRSRRGRRRRRMQRRQRRRRRRRKRRWVHLSSGLQGVVRHCAEDGQALEEKEVDGKGGRGPFVNG